MIKHCNATWPVVYLSCSVSQTSNLHLWAERTYMGYFSVQKLLDFCCFVYQAKQEMHYGGWHYPCVWENFAYTADADADQGPCSWGHRRKDEDIKNPPRPLKSAMADDTGRIRANISNLLCCDSKWPPPDGGSRWHRRDGSHRGGGAPTWRRTTTEDFAAGLLLYWNVIFVVCCVARRVSHWRRIDCYTEQGWNNRDF